MKLFVSGLTLLIFLIVTCELTAHNSSPIVSDQTGIVFFKGSWKDVLAEAKHQNKPVFLDVYTSWCPPCKRMAKEAFPNPKVGTKFNVHFINYQLDAEKGEGIQLAKQFAVASYPTALYIAPNGDLIYRAVGYSGINGMLDQADRMLDLPRLRTTLAKGDNDFVEGKRDLNFLRRYVKTRQSLNRPTHDVLDAYIDALPEHEQATSETLTYVAETLESSDTKAFGFLIKKRPLIRSSDLTSQQLVTTISDALARALTNDFKQACATTDEVLLEKTIRNSERNTASAESFGTQQQSQHQATANRYRLQFYKQTRNFVKYRTIAEPIAQQQLMVVSAGESTRLAADSATQQENAVAHSLYEIADTYRELGTSPADWQAAITWATRSIDLHRSHEYLNTYALLLYKLGQKEEAINAQKEAICEAEKVGRHTEQYKNELASMKGN
ncbi:thioredoxin fold domain-containing protein [Spirosoma pollinicola]|uniref:Thioredoxin n=1 Tax=Spirosoma pollinicola TaxID=2057025 RepID=A0A2K8YY47_9BACT|nr:thioredoxin fold domain-containing protein [Spirosoma pollinicola]AUD02542.1 thioredoxin [Spirosoma pollinicola]